MSPPLSHIDQDGRVNMVDVGDKPITERSATARGIVTARAETIQLVREGRAKKGDVITVAELAGIIGAKQTSALIPLCHPLALSSVNVSIEIMDATHFSVRAIVKTRGQTGVEMEALSAVSTACLTLYDMLKAVDKAMIIGPIEVMEKTGGRSGTYRSENPDNEHD